MSAFSVRRRPARPKLGVELRLYIDCAARAGLHQIVRTSLIVLISLGVLAPFDGRVRISEERSGSVNSEIRDLGSFKADGPPGGLHGRSDCLYLYSSPSLSA